MELEDVLSDKEPEKKEEAPKSEVVVEAEKTDRSQEYVSRKKQAQAKEWEAQGRDPATGQYIKKEKPEENKPEDKPAEKPVEKAAEKPKEELSEKERGFLAAAQEERRKRQDLERRLAELEKAKPAAPAEHPKAFWDDPEGALAKHNESTAALKKDMEGMATKIRLDTAEQIARSKYSDFDEKIQVFADLVQKNPALAGPWLSSPDPAEYAYKQGKNYMEFQAVGNMDAFREKIEKETRLKLEAEYQEKQKALEKERAAIPPSLSDARGTQTHRPVWNGPLSLDDVLSSK
jgi:hypothetical protein